MQDETRWATYATRHRRHPLCKPPLKSNPNRALGGRFFNFVPATITMPMKKKKERKVDGRFLMRGLIEVCVCLVEGKLIFDIRAFGLGAVFGAWRSHWNQLDIHRDWVKFKNPWSWIVRLAGDNYSSWSKIISNNRGKISIFDVDFLFIASDF